MLDMIIFWFSYGVFILFLWGFIAYWSVSLLDKWFDIITDGDYKHLISHKFRNPLLNKFGLMEKTDVLGNVRKYGDWKYMFQDDIGFSSNNRWSAITVFWFGIFGLFVNGCFIVAKLGAYCDSEELTSYHQFGVNVSEFAVEFLSTPILIGILMIVLHTVIKNAYKFGKRVKLVLDKQEEK